MCTKIRIPKKILIFIQYRKLNYSWINSQEKQERRKEEEQQRLQCLQEQEKAERILTEQRRRE